MALGSTPATAYPPPVAPAGTYGYAGQPQAWSQQQQQQQQWGANDYYYGAEYQYATAAVPGAEYQYSQYGAGAGVAHGAAAPAAPGAANSAEYYQYQQYYSNQPQQ